jgi:hypothetical protein
VNLGGEPDRDDSGLPPVDIEIPDDARELDRDVQAYHREQRARRRHQRRLRWRLPLTKDGVVLPLLASCMVLALIAGTLLTVFAAGPGDGLPGAPGVTDTANVSRPPASARVSPSDSPTAVPARKLPSRAIELGGGGRILLPTMTDVVLALVPAGCDCTAAVNDLVRQASSAGVRVYLIGSAGHLPPVRRLASRSPAPAFAAADVSGALYRSYPHTGLTALLVDGSGAVSVAAGLTPGFRLSSQLRGLHAAPSSPGAGGPGGSSAPAAHRALDGPSGTGSASTGAVASPAAG